MNQQSPIQPHFPEALPSWGRIVFEKIQSLQFGSVQITIHDGKVTQVECTEKIRIRPADSNRADS
ncbi:YezD family protein [Pelagicoccus sp. SDUM812003]|uniref:YezD family protein n=1 Tax=Pelagicoccus sp. SDUM812003 TaxID=3041267 RepID=UPI00280FEC04|nr:YezD family protein [Pelagicoccus sp. SDUM812003]MDQ8205585.1 YezD family protein [Pelagicoccus sp. SDUM812003]